jgi:ADP-heptose:LPS heptosyltransferase
LAKKILIIRFSSIGDIVLTSPVIRCLKQQLKDAEIHYLTKKSFSGILENNPYVNKIHTIENNVSEVLGELKSENYDHIIDLHNNLRSLQVKRAIGKPSASFRKLNLQKWLLVNFKIGRLPKIHVVDRYMETVKHLNVVNDNQGLDYFIPASEEVNLSVLPATHQNGYIGFVIGAKHYTKQLPAEKIISICKKINIPIVLLGGKEDEAKGEQIKNAIGNLAYNACGKYNLHQSASLIKNANKIITHDTGLMHIASAFKKEIISVWGNTVPEFGMLPYISGQGSKIIEVKGLPCRPCSKIGYDKCPKGHFNCMNGIDESLF